MWRPSGKVWQQHTSKVLWHYCYSVMICEQVMLAHFLVPAGSIDDIKAVAWRRPSETESVLPCQVSTSEIMSMFDSFSNFSKSIMFSVLLFSDRLFSSPALSADEVDWQWRLILRRIRDCGRSAWIFGWLMVILALSDHEAAGGFRRLVEAISIKCATLQPAHEPRPERRHGGIPTKSLEKPTWFLGGSRRVEPEVEQFGTAVTDEPFDVAIVIAHLARCMNCEEVLARRESRMYIPYVRTVRCVRWLLRKRCTRVGYGCTAIAVYMSPL